MTVLPNEHAVRANSGVTKIDKQRKKVSCLKEECQNTMLSMTKQKLKKHKLQGGIHVLHFSKKSYQEYFLMSSKYKNAKVGSVYRNEVPITSVVLMYCGKGKHSR